MQCEKMLRILTPTRFKIELHLQTFHFSFKRSSFTHFKCIFVLCANRIVKLKAESRKCWGLHFWFISCCLFREAWSDFLFLFVGTLHNLYGSCCSGLLKCDSFLLICRCHYFYWSRAMVIRILFGYQRCSQFTY